MSDESTGTSSSETTSVASDGQEQNDSHGQEERVHATPNSNEKNLSAQRSDKKATQQKQAATPTADDEFEEIKVGGVSGKVPKALAKIVKDLERGFHVTAQDRAKLQRELGETKSRIKKDIWKLAEDEGLNPDELAEARLLASLQRAQMSPEQIELEQHRQEKAERKAKEAEEKIKAERENMTRAEQAEMVKLDKEIGEAFKEVIESGGLPKDPFFLQLIVSEMRNSEIRSERGHGAPLSARDAAGIIKDKYQTHLRDVFTKMNPDGIEKVLGDAILKKIREHAVGKHLQSAPNYRPQDKRPGFPPASANKNQKKAPLDEKGWQAEIERIRNG